MCLNTCTKQPFTSLNFLHAIFFFKVNKSIRILKENKIIKKKKKPLYKQNKIKRVHKN